MGLMVHKFMANVDAFFDPDKNGRLSLIPRSWALIARKLSFLAQVQVQISPPPSPSSFATPKIRFV
ncbi:hypothetical protein LTS07_009291 [Exophiala sideris]|nr:hypothetical protein LTS07_009291 [Exophiala sideris]